MSSPAVVLHSALEGLEGTEGLGQELRSSVCRDADYVQRVGVQTHDRGRLQP